MSALSSIQTEPAAEVAGLRKAYTAGVVALSDVSLVCPHGAITALLGPNGSGKSTILRILAGADSDHTGTVRVAGFDLYRSARHLRSIIGYVTQRSALDPELTGMEHLRLFHALRGLRRLDRDTHISRHIDEFGLHGFIRRLTSGYSGGERQRLHLAIETIHSPRVLLLDEPTTSLDPDGRRDFWHHVARTRDSGGTVVIATHDLDDAEVNADYVAILHNGNVVADGAMNTILATHPAAGASITFESNFDDDRARPMMKRVRSIPNIVDASIRRGVLTIWRSEHPTTEHDPVLDILSDLDISVKRYELIRPGLAAAYFRLTGDVRGRGRE